MANRARVQDLIFSKNVGNSYWQVPQSLYIKHKHELKTFLCQVRIVKSFEKQSKWKDDIGLPEREYYQKLLAQLKCPLVYKEGLKFDF